jgi:hypothetical protein
MANQRRSLTTSHPSLLVARFAGYLMAHVLNIKYQNQPGNAHSRDLSDEHHSRLLKEKRNDVFKIREIDEGCREE